MSLIDSAASAVVVAIVMLLPFVLTAKSRQAGRQGCFLGSAVGGNDQNEGARQA